MFARFSLMFLLVAAGAGCSTHPLPEDFSRATTYDIFQSIRCEVQHGLKNFHVNFPAVEGGASGRFPDAKYLADTQIAYDFSFTMTERNKANQGALEFTNVFSGGSFKLDFKGKAEKERGTVRTFVVTESLAELTNSNACEMASRPNLLYPIAGRVGADEILTTYLRLERDYRFRKLEDPANGKSKVFSDLLTFTTDLTAGVTPTLTLNTGSNKFKLRKFSVNGNAQRVDTHKLTVAIATVVNSSGFSRRANNLVIYDYSTRTFRRSAPIARLTDGNPARDLVLEEIYRVRALEDDRQRFELVTPIP